MLQPVDSPAPPRPLSMRRKVLYSALTTALALAVLLGLAEVGLRIAYGSVARITGVSDWSLNSWEGITYYWDEYHPRLGWTNVAGYRGDQGLPFRVTINRQRLRALRDYTPAPSPPVRRVALFGDSCIFGEEVDDDATVPAILEGRLQDVEALNYGVHGYGLGQMLLRLEEEGFDLAPHHVVVAVYLPQDVFRDTNPNFCHSKPVFSEAAGELRIENIPVPLALQQPWIVRHSYLAAWLSSRASGRFERTDLDSHIRRTRIMLARLAETCKRWQVPLTVTILTVPGNLEEARARPAAAEVTNVLRRAVHDSGVDALDLIQVLEAAYAEHGGRLVAPHGHWSGEGNALIAEQIAEHLADRDPAWRRVAPPSTPEQ